ncbi:dTMP kinase [Lacticaseibacillus thailandensis]|uniref:Thymidylate kinase n=1 Tax=Lacticaseibacillus thailandensis DSM 22698 = JCM 13996 TaxID=1423810 RepID=A0A0R2C4H0_9LACO|nr:dTMP kinase [Lacticaseibacillus thailandensis]KRM86799.1 thymidylate kinase [Lacticaseibacillus thailandensis DSM 22698 = JCM 13996]
MTGVFITFEGPDGAGKDSVLLRVVPALAAHLRVPLVETREPGGARISERIRDLILDPDNTEMDPRTEAILYAASRRQHLVEKIRPALAAGKVVICDRFVDSSIAYQGAGRGIGEAAVAALNDFATEGLKPDLTVYLDVPASVGLARINAHRRDTQYDRLDQETESFHDRVRTAYLKLAAANPQRIKTIDATQALDQVCADTLAVLQQYLVNYWQE